MKTLVYMAYNVSFFLLGGRKNMAAIGSMRKKLTGFSDEGDDDYGSAGMYFNPSMFPPHRPEKEVFLCCRIYFK